jgi:pyrimidine deaminase RibD-like protein/RNA-binding protein YhbY
LVNGQLLTRPRKIGSFIEFKALTSRGRTHYYDTKSKEKRERQLISIVRDSRLRKRCFLSLLHSPDAPLDNESLASDEDRHYMLLAVEYAKLGYGGTFPNPAVGCVLVQREELQATAGLSSGDTSSTSFESDSKVIGAGFHPRAGWPHAEIFALLEACGHFSDVVDASAEWPVGVHAAKAVVDAYPSGGTMDEAAEPSSSAMERLLSRIKELTAIYTKTANGPAQLFENNFASTGSIITAYVTLEPCCHTGRTPPCASSLLLAGVHRVVIGYRDPNPKVDGGGVALLRQAGIEVRVMACEEAASIVTNFCRRITPRRVDQGGGDWQALMTGAFRSSIRSLAGQWKAAGKLAELSWDGGVVDGESAVAEAASSSVDETLDSAWQQVENSKLDSRWMEQLDALLWEHELVLVRLKSAVSKRKMARLLGERIGNELDAHVAQVVGHTCLLYRPGKPPSLVFSTVQGELHNFSFIHKKPPDAPAR